MVIVETAEEKAISLLGVPIIDVTSLILLNQNNNNEEFATASKEIVKQIGDACKNWGFFYVVGHQISKELIERVKQDSANFMNKPKEFKKLFDRKENNLNGYFDTEFTKQTLDWKEGWDLEAYEGSIDNNGPQGSSQWPEGMPEFKKTIKEFFEELRKLAFELMKAMFAGLNGDMDYVEKQFGPKAHTSLFRINHYPKCQNPEAHFGVGQHTDAGGLTVLLQDDDVTSLQVQRNEVWYNVPPVPDSFVINTGDMVRVWSNGIYHAPLHRVLANKTSERYSFPFFFAPSYDTTIQPLEQCVTKERPLRYRPINWGYFRSQRFAGDYADVGEEIQTTHYEIKD